MKISVDGKYLFTISDVQKKVFAYDIPSEKIDEQLKGWLIYILLHKYDWCFDRLKIEWDTKLIAGGAESLPTDKDKYAELVFSQESYKNRSEKEEAISKRKRDKSIGKVEPKQEGTL